MALAIGGGLRARPVRLRRKASVVEGVLYQRGVDHPGLVRDPSMAGDGLFVLTAAGERNTPRDGDLILPDGAPGRFYVVPAARVAELYEPADAGRPVGEIVAEAIAALDGVLSADPSPDLMRARARMQEAGFWLAQVPKG